LQAVVVRVSLIDDLAANYITRMSGHSMLDPSILEAMIFN
jgi:SOS-response transcriptional repressor LexA